MNVVCHVEIGAGGMRLNMHAVNGGGEKKEVGQVSSFIIMLSCRAKS